MKLERIHLEGFRNYDSLDIEFPERLIFIIGENGSGKSNLLEAISMLSFGKSFRSVSDHHLVQKGRTCFSINAVYLRNNLQFTLDYLCDFTITGKRKIKRNGKLLSGRPAMAGDLATVVFSPQDLQIVEGGPSSRRQFIDSVISIRSYEYFSDLLHYNKTLRQRNALLKALKEKKGRLDDLFPWDKELAETALRLRRMRFQFLDEFIPFFKDALERISLGRDEINLSMNLSGKFEQQSVEEYSSNLQESVWKDISAGFTTSGPHRDNLTFQYEDGDILTSGSQGQKRSLVLALRIAQFFYLRKSLGVSPLLLIDDVIRELDASRRAAFIGLLGECGQAFFTSPDLDGLEEFLSDHKKIIYVVKNGSVFRQ